MIFCFDHFHRQVWKWCKLDELICNIQNRLLLKKLRGWVFLRPNEKNLGFLTPLSYKYKPPPLPPPSKFLIRNFERRSAENLWRQEALAGDSLSPRAVSLSPSLSLLRASLSLRREQPWVVVVAVWCVVADLELSFFLVSDLLKSNLRWGVLNPDLFSCPFILLYEDLGLIRPLLKARMVYHVA